MPFDGTPALTAVDVLDWMRELFGPHGEHWGQGDDDFIGPDGVRRWCIMGALHKVTGRGHHHLKVAVVDALGAGIAARNDFPTTSFRDIERWLLDARERVRSP